MLLLTVAPLPQFVKVVLLAYFLIFSCLSLQRVYGGPIGQTLLKGIGVASAYLISLLAMTAILGLWAILE